RDEDRDLEGYHPRRRSRSGERRDPRRQNDERERAEEERHVHVRSRRVGYRAQRDADEDQHVDDLRDRRDKVERVQAGDSRNLPCEQKTQQSAPDDDNSWMQTALIREYRRRDPNDDLPP